MSRTDDIKKLLKNNSRRLQKLKEKQSLEGMDAAPKTLMEIEDIEAEIESLQIELAKAEASEVEAASTAASAASHSQAQSEQKATNQVKMEPCKSTPNDQFRRVFMKCSNCGTKLSQEAKFCSECGTEAPPKDAKGGYEARVNIKIDTVGKGGTVKGIHNEYVRGDKVGRDKTTISDATGVAVGDQAQASVTQGLSGEEIARLFAPIYQMIEEKTNLPAQVKADLKAEVDEIKAEASKQDPADVDESFLARRLRNIERMAPDIIDTIVMTVVNPVAGVGGVWQKIRAKSREVKAARA